MSILKEKTDTKELSQIKKDTKKLTREIMLFLLRVRVVTFLLINLKRLKTIILSLIPTIVYNDMTIPFVKFRSAAKGDFLKIAIFGYNKKKCIKAFEKISNEKIDRFGINKDIKKDMMEEARILLAEAEALKDQRKENRYERMKESFLNTKQELKDYSLDEIAIIIGTFFKDKNVNINKMSLESVMTSFEIIKNGNSE